MKFEDWDEFKLHIDSKIKPMEVEHINLYQKETVEHLVDQLIRLQESYNDTYMTSTGINKDQIMEAMKKINKALETALITKLILK